MFGRQTRNSGTTVTVAPSNATTIFNENNVTQKGVTTRSSRPALKDLSNQVNEITKRVDKDKKDAEAKKAALPAIQIPVKNANPTAKNPTLKENIMLNANKQMIAKPQPQAKPKEDIEVDDLESPFDEEEEEYSEDEETQEQFDAMEIERLGEVRPLHLHDNESEELLAPLDESIDDIDLNDMDDPQFCSEYVHLIFNYLRKVEEKLKPDAHYMEKQKDITEKHRAILVDWLVDVGVRFKLLTETMFLTIHILDRFLSVRVVSRQKLQLVGMAAMLISSKIEEIYTPQVKDFVWICANTYPAEDILMMEKQMLVALGFNINAAHALHFLRRFSKAGHAESKTHTLAKYIIELSLIEFKLLKYLPSTIAASAVYISRKMGGITPLWTKTLAFYSQLQESDIMDCVVDLNEIVKRQSADGKLKAVYLKYASEKLSKVALIPPVNI